MTILIPPPVQALFAEVDTDSTGGISAQELHAALLAHGAEMDLAGCRSLLHEVQELDKYSWTSVLPKSITSSKKTTKKRSMQVDLIAVSCLKLH